MASPLAMSELIHIYKSPSEHHSYIKKIQETFSVDDKLLLQTLQPTFPSELVPKQNSKIYFKFINDKKNHHGLQYPNKNGLIVDPTPFKPTGCCSGGGIYFTELERLHMFKQFGTNIHAIIVPDDFPIYDEICTTPDHKCVKYNYKSKGPVVYLSEPIRLGSDESIELLYDHTKNTPNNELVQRHMFRSNNLKYLDWYKQYYNDFYRNGPNNLSGPVEKPVVLAKTIKKSHPLQKQIICCKVKELILTSHYEQLFDIIYYKKPILDWFYHSPTYILFSDQGISISNLFYIFLTYRNTLILNFMKNEYIPRLLELPHIIDAQSKSRAIQVDLPTAISNINENMAKMIDENIYNTIIEYHGEISGSFILKHLTGLPFENDDIDVYLPVFEANCDGYYENAYSKTPLPENTKIWLKYMQLLTKIRESYGNTATAYYADSGTYNMNNLEGIINIVQTNGLKLQLIFVKVDPYAFITDNFDFDFCKCCFNPANDSLQYEHPNLNNLQTGVITKTYMNKILKYDMMDSYSVYRAAKTMDRITKYIERGFIITNLEEFFTCIAKLFV